MKLDFHTVPRTASTSGVASAPSRIDVSTMRASRKHARARCCRTLASSSRSAPARRRCARIAVAGGGGRRGLEHARVARPRHDAAARDGADAHAEEAALRPARHDERPCGS